MSRSEVMRAIGAGLGAALITLSTLLIGPLAVLWALYALGVVGFSLKNLLAVAVLYHLTRPVTTLELVGPKA